MRLKIQPSVFEKSNELDNSQEKCYPLTMNQKFIAVPREIYVDAISKKLIPTDIMVYMYLCAKCAHGNPVYICRTEMCRDLGGISLSKLSDSFKRLCRNRHLNRRKLNGTTSTSLLTFVKDRSNIYIKGELQSENRS